MARLAPASRPQAVSSAAAVEALNCAIWLSRDAHLAQTAERLDLLAERFHGPAGEPGPHLDPGPSASPALHAGPAPIAGPFGRQLDQLQGAAG